MIFYNLLDEYRDMLKTVPEDQLNAYTEAVLHCAAQRLRGEGDSFGGGIVADTFYLAANIVKREPA